MLFISKKKKQVYLDFERDVRLDFAEKYHNMELYGPRNIIDLNC